MFSKVIIADDLGSINQGVISVLTSLGIQDIEQVQYCDDAYLKIKKAIMINEPYKLIITDLSFKKDHREQKLTSGEALIEALRNDSIDINIIAYSIDDRLQKVRSLFLNFNINAYVCKGRKGLDELAMAIKDNYAEKQYLSPSVKNALSEKLDLEISDYDIRIMTELSKGMSYEQISILFKEQKVSPSSVSSIEKKANKLRDQFQAINTTHLVIIVKDIGLI
ncbi:response regulator [Flavobacterium litorale]|uniref:Response regulator n=1 Tax=Flavobacterium litorale TaxID=2856519 RepID=A0ABX8V606_9FLAO|nr:response regulator [Flavobacterium litorale]QYJ68257.1 response regulator [Flavobacterium litorale]